MELTEPGRLVDAHLKVARHLCSRPDGSGLADAASLLADASRAVPPPMDEQLLAALAADALAPLLGGGGSAGERQARLTHELRARPTLLHACHDALARYLERDPGREQQYLAQRLLDELRGIDAADQGAPRSDEPSPGQTVPGTVNVLIVDPRSGQGACRRMHVVLQPKPDADDEVVTGCSLSGSADRGLEAATSYLDAADVCDIADHQALCVIGGQTTHVEGESLELPLVVAALSACLDLPVPAPWTFTGRLTVPSGVSSSGSEIAVLPVDAVATKTRAALTAGMQRILIPAGSADEVSADLHDVAAEQQCEIVPVADLGEVIEQVFPAHRRPVPEEASVVQTFRARRRWQYVGGAAVVVGLLYAHLAYFNAWGIEPNPKPTDPHPAAIAVAIACGLLAGGVCLALLLWPYICLPRGCFPNWKYGSLTMGGAGMLCAVLTYYFAASRAGMVTLSESWPGHPWSTIYKDAIIYAAAACLYLIGPHNVICDAEYFMDRRRWRAALTALSGENELVGFHVVDKRWLLAISLAAMAPLVFLDGLGALQVAVSMNTIFVFSRLTMLLILIAGSLAWYVSRRSMLMQEAELAMKGQPGKPVEWRPAMGSSVS